VWRSQENPGAQSFVGSEELIIPACGREFPDLATLYSTDNFLIFRSYTESNKRKLLQVQSQLQSGRF
jgi:hypothetical protein